LSELVENEVQSQIAAAVAAATQTLEPTQPQPPQQRQPSPEPVAADLPASVDWQPGQLHILGPIAVPGLAPRRVRIYLPASFTPQAQRFSLYLFDGQNDFDDGPSFAGGWHVDKAIEKLDCASRPAPIVIAVDHGGSERLRELSPFPVGDRDDDPAFSGQLDLLLDWMTGHLMPRLGAMLPLVGSPLGAVVAGSSLGGLAAMYAHFRHHEAFGGALVMSPSFWLHDVEILRWIAEQPTPEVSRVYLDCGVREGRGTVLPQVAAMAAHLGTRGYNANHLMFRADPRGTHSEASWRRRLPRALRFFYRTHR
jgi:predicted alpha/beta superfamily hydrolase